MVGYSGGGGDGGGGGGRLTVQPQGEHVHFISELGAGGDVVTSSCLSKAEHPMDTEAATMTRSTSWSTGSGASRLPCRIFSPYFFILASSQRDNSTMLPLFLLPSVLLEALTWLA